MFCNKTHFFAVFALALIAGVILLAGCVESGQSANDQNAGGPQMNGSSGNYSRGSWQGTPSNHSWPGPRMNGSGGNYSRGPWQNRSGNLTEEQMQQMIEQMRRAAADACNGRAEGDSCAMQTPRGNATGTCSAQNYSLVCNAGMVGGRFPE
jgi:hypothetical protein